MSYKPSDAYYCEFTTQTPSSGAAVNADSLPVATANHNGADDATFVLTVLNIDTGRYKISGTIPSGYAAGDTVNVTVAAIVATVTGKALVDRFVLDSKRFADVVDAAGNVNADVKTIATQAVTCAAPITVLASVGTAATSTAQTGDNFARIGANGAGLTAIGLAATQAFNNTGQTTNTPVDVQTIKTQTITCAAPVTVLASVGTAAASIAQTGDSFARIGVNGAGLTAVTANLGTTAPANWINTAAFAAGATLPVVNLVNTLTTYTGNTPQTGDSFARIGAAGASLTAVALAATQTFSNTGTWTGNLSGSVGSVNGVTFPANFGATVISTGGVVNANVVDWVGLAPNPLISGNLPANVNLGGNAPSGWLNAAAFAAGAITPAAVATGVYPMQVGPDFTNVKQATVATTLNNITVPTVTTAANAPSAATIANVVWTDATAADFTALGSVGLRLMSGTSLLDSVIVEAGSPTLNGRQALCLILAANAGGVTGANTATIIINGAGTSTARITSNNPDVYGDRPNVALNPPA